MRSMAELHLLTTFDYLRCELLPYFCYAGPTESTSFPSLATIAKKGKSQLLATMKIPFYNRHGDENGYLGYKYKHSLRYDFSYGDYLRLGFLGAQDAGEPFFANDNRKGYDFYSFYLMIRKLGRLKALAVGRYKVKFGLGLVMNNNMGFGKLATMGALTGNGNAIRPYSSRSEANYLQGAAATVAIAKHVDASAFVSYRKIDATLNKDSGTVATILTSGYHRTKSEMERRNNTSQTLAGVNMSWQAGGFHAGITGVYIHYDRELRPNTKQRYRAYYPSGSSFWNAGISYGYTSARLSINGETATGDSHALATLNIMSYKPWQDLTITAIQRFYGKKYTAPMAESFSEGGRVQNESGIFLGVNWQPVRGLQLSGYTDYAYFAWPRYQAGASSHSWDNLLSAVYTRKAWTFTARYRFKTRQKDNQSKTALCNENTQRARLSMAYNGDKWSTKTQGDFAYNTYKQTSRGWMVSEQASCTLLPWLTAAANIGYFHTDDYASRIYSYERGPLYQLSFPAFYGEGIRYALFLKAQTGKNLMAIVKAGTTDYFDRDHISSGLQQIDRSSQTDMEIQVKWKF